MEELSLDYQENVRWFNETLGVGRSCDMVSRDLRIGGRRARVWVVDGFGGDAVLERMGAFWLGLDPAEVGVLTEKPRRKGDSSMGRRMTPSFTSTPTPVSDSALSIP